jgi:glycerate-2-kinase
MAVVRAALVAADAGRLVRRAMRAPDAERRMRAAGAIDVIAAGKAAASMLSAFVTTAPAALRRVIGIGPTRPADMPVAARWYAAAHPVPDEDGVRAGRTALDVAVAAGERDLLVVLLSGGASAMMVVPGEGITLSDKQQASAELLRLGAEIHGLNAVRKHLSDIKGGQLAAACAGSTLTFALSDVVGDDLSAIGSGPTVPDETTFADALAALERYGGPGRYPRAVAARLVRGAAGAIAETRKPGDPRLARAVARVIGANATALAGARTAAEELGYTVHVIDGPVVGEARLAAHGLIDSAKTHIERVARVVGSGPAGRVCVIAGGETTVRTDGSGKGGRNQELALAMARKLDRLGGVAAAASVGTDGIDGPTDAAGAIVDSTTLARAEAADIGPPERALEEHNSYVFFDELHDLIRTGPTGTNVGDLQVILVASR